MKSAEFDESNMPPIGGYNASLELEAAQRGISPEEEFRRRMEAMGHHVVSDGVPRLHALRKIISKIRHAKT